MAEHIEREKVYEMLNAIGGCGAEPESWADGWDKAIDTAVKELSDIPTADVRPERHGKWVGDVALYPRCSVCNGLAGYAIDGTHEPTAYCPNCGAKMDGKDNE